MEDGELKSRIASLLGEDVVEDVAENMVRRVEEEYGEVPFVVNFLRRKPEILVSRALTSMQIKGCVKGISNKVVEMISIAAAVASGSEYCTDLHIRAALRAGATEDEVFGALLVASQIAESSRLAIGLRGLEKSR
jgi:AhpD family alkylhydroperoxidase